MMKSITQILLVQILMILFQVQRTIGYSINKLKSDIDCLSYANDNHIIDSFPFPVPLDPTFENPEITYAKTDKNLNIYHLRIVNQKNIPPLIYCLKHLTELELVNIDSSQDFPLKLEYLPLSMIELIISDTKITYVPKEIGRFKYLEVLFLINTGLTSLSNAIGGLSALNVLILSGNNLKSLPITMKNLRKLKRINLSNNPHLSSIESLNGLPSLEYLDAKECSITVPPRNLPLLDELHLSSNKLTTLTDIETLGNGTDNSKSFYFDQNYIRTIPPQIQYVRNLHELNLRRNRLHSLPITMFKLTTLTDLNIQQNPFHPQDREITVTRLRQAIPSLNVLHD